jgi:hypothetical protein
MVCSWSSVASLEDDEEVTVEASSQEKAQAQQHDVTQQQDVASNNINSMLSTASALKTAGHENSPGLPNRSISIGGQLILASANTAVLKLLIHKYLSRN